MSTAWYKPHAVPKLLQSFARKDSSSSSASTIIQVWSTTCIVRNFGKTRGPHCSTLINPSNPSLLGVQKFPYFPRGGPEPVSQPDKDPHHIMAYVTQWGGMDLKYGMLFPPNVVDGLVHELGGWSLRLWCQLMALGRNNDEICPVGQAVTTPALGYKLRREYDRIIHTVPPFYRHHTNPEYYLAECYRNALKLAFSYDHRVACPLLGAGGRGFPLEIAIRIAAQESVQWRNNAASNSVLAFSIPESRTAETLIEAIADVEQDERCSASVGEC